MTTTRAERRQELTHQILLELLAYVGETGQFVARIARGAAPMGKVVGTVTKDGYCWITIDRVQYPAGRLAWFYVYGQWPDGEIDHKDTNPSNNRIENLRDVTPTVNKQNKRRAQAGKKYSPLLGAQWCKQAGKWKSSIRVSGRTKHLGFFPSDEAAAGAYVEAKRKFHEGCTL